MGFLLVLALCLFAALAGARGALLVPIVLWPVDRLPWPAALLALAVSFLAWRAFRAPQPRAASSAPRSLEARLARARLVEEVPPDA